jgi:iron complex outermembrane recepter protein
MRAPRTELAANQPICVVSDAPSPNGIGPLDPNTKIGGYTLLNARVEWNNIVGSMVHAAAYVRNMLNKQYEVGGVGLGATVGLDAVILGTNMPFSACGLETLRFAGRPFV